MLLLYIRICFAVVMAACVAYAYVDNNVGMAGYVITCVTWAGGKIIIEAMEAAAVLGLLGRSKKE